MTVKELFDKAENGTLTWEQFQTAMGDAKFVDLTEGNYVSKQKYDNEIEQRDNQITTLNETITQRNADLKNLQTTLKEAGDLEELRTASKNLADLQKKYDKDMKAYKQQLSQQEYEFAVKDFANSKNFTSNAAKRDFIQSMLAKDLKIEDGKIIGAEDFVEIYSKDNADAFVVKQDPEPKTEPKPQFTKPTGNNEPKKLTLSEMMQMKNENPDVDITF